MDPNKTNNTAAMDQAALASFADDLIAARYQGGNPPQNADQVKALLLKEINEAINSHLIAQLEEKDQVDLDELLDKNPTDQELNKFFAERIPNLDVEIASALLNFRAAYLLPLEQPINLQEEVNKAMSGSEGQSSATPPPPPPAPVTD